MARKIENGEQKLYVLNTRVSVEGGERVAEENHQGAAEELRGQRTQVRTGQSHDGTDFTSQSIYPSCLCVCVLPVRVLELSEELLQRRRQEEREAQDLENMVHSVEQNLHLMTVRFPERPRTQDHLFNSLQLSLSLFPLQKRAVKAENSVSKLKVELQQLQVRETDLY